MLLYAMPEPILSSLKPTPESLQQAFIVVFQRTFLYAES